MLRYLFLLFFLISSVSLPAQKWLNKLKDKVNQAVEDVSSDDFMDNGGLVGKGRAKQLEKDTSNYNYIFSQGNRASFFANRDSKESIFLTASKNYEDEEGNKVELETYEKIFDANRAGERMMYVNAGVANFNFAQAMGLLTNDVSMFRLAFDTAFAISSLVNMDTLSTPEKYALGKTIANYSILTHAQGRYNLSKDFLLQTERYFEEEIGKGSVALASIYCNLGVVDQSQGYFTEAENYFNKALDVN